MRGKIIRDFNDYLSPELREKFMKVVKKKEKIERIELEFKDKTLRKILIIGPNSGLKCHFSENIYDEFIKANFDAKYIGINKLKLNEMHIKKGMRYPISNILNTLKDWKPQLIIIDQININFSNMQSIPVFYHHREFKRPPTVFYPTVVFFWHEDILKYYERMFAKEWMSQVRYKEIMTIAFSFDTWKPKKKLYKGVNAFGSRESFKECYIANELANMADIMLLEQEHEEIKKYVNYFDGKISDNEFRKLMPQCEAVWIPQSVRQFTSRAMLEAMACKTLCIIKLENERHEEILAKMGLEDGVHYIGIEHLEEIELAFQQTPNKEEIIENAYELVHKKHTYKNRMNEIIELYNKIVNGEKK